MDEVGQVSGGFGVQPALLDVRGSTPAEVEGLRGTFYCDNGDWIEGKCEIIDGVDTNTITYHYGSCQVDRSLGVNNDPRYGCPGAPACYKPGEGPLVYMGRFVNNWPEALGQVGQMALDDFIRATRESGAVWVGGVV